MSPGRSREGAWIEIFLRSQILPVGDGRSREGAWIEITGVVAIEVVVMVAPVRERGLK